MQALSGLWNFAVAWYNLPFTVALLGFLALIGMQFLGLEHAQEADADADADLEHDVDLDHDVDVDHDVDMDHDADLDHDAEMDHDADVEHDADLDHGVDHDAGHEVEHDAGHDGAHEVSQADGTPLWASALGYVGAGQTPLTIILLLLLGTFGSLGWLLNVLILGVAPQYPAWAVALVLPVDLAAGVWVTGRMARVLGRAVPAFATTATPLRQLVGRRGRVASPHVDEHYGQVKLRDAGGTLLTVFALVDPGKPPIARDTEVVLVDFDPDHKVFIVVPADL